MSVVEGSALVLFSGGQDSAACLAWALDRFARVETVGFDYGQRHRVELDQRAPVRNGIAALSPAWAEHMGGDHMLDLGALGAISETSLTRETAIMVENNGLPSTFVPGRNLIFLSFAAALAYRRGISAIVAGVCETDYTGYPDCRAETIAAMERALNLGMEAGFTLHTPLMRLTKAETWALAEQLGGEPLVTLIREETHSCYLGDRTPHHWGKGCGQCPACDLRAKGWAEYRRGGGG